MSNFITIINDGKKLKSTTYWDTEHAKRGFVYASWNAGAIRLLIPDAHLESIPDMINSQYVILSEGTFQGRKKSFEVLFEDGSDAPYSIHMVNDQSDGIGEHGKTYDFLLYSQSKGLIKETKAKYRKVDTLPCLAPWSE